MRSGFTPGTDVERKPPSRGEVQRWEASEPSLHRELTFWNRSLKYVDKMESDAVSDQQLFLRQWREFKGITQTELARRVGITKGEISRLEGGSRRMTVEWIKRLSQGLQIDQMQLWTAPPVFKNMEEKLADHERKLMGLDLGVTAANVNIELVAIEGDEMKGTLEPGDLVIVDKERGKVPRAGLFLIEENGAQVVRRLQWQLDGKAVRVSCDNKVYEPVEVDASTVTISGRVTGVIRRI